MISFILYFFFRHWGHCLIWLGGGDSWFFLKKCFCCVFKYCVVVVVLCVCTFCVFIKKKKAYTQTNNNIFVLGLTKWNCFSKDGWVRSFPLLRRIFVFVTSYFLFLYFWITQICEFSIILTKINLDMLFWQVLSKLWLWIVSENTVIFSALVCWRKHQKAMEFCNILSVRIKRWSWS